MWITLTQDIGPLGPAGSSVEVPEGYAVNFLFPQHLAFARDGAPQEEVQEKPARATAEEREAERLAEELDGVEVVVAGKVKKDIFVQPITKKEVRSALKDMGYRVALQQIIMPPITEPGTHEVLLEFSAGFEATITVIAEAIS